MAADETEKPKEEEQAQAPPKKKGKLKLIIIIVAVLVLGGGAAAYFFLFSGGTEPEGGVEAAAEGGAEGAGEAGAEEAPVVLAEDVTFSLDNFIVNVEGDVGDIRYLKIEIMLELENEAMEKEVEMKTPKIRDSILTILTNKSVADISDVNGKLRLKEEMKARINSFLVLGKIKDVYFTEFIIQ